MGLIRIDLTQFSRQCESIPFLRDLCAQIADSVDNARKRGAHLGLEVAIVEATLFERALRRFDAEFVRGDLNPKVGPQLLDVPTQADVTSHTPAADGQRQHYRLQDMTKIDLGRKPRSRHHGTKGAAGVAFNNSASTPAQTG